MNIFQITFINASSKMSRKIFSCLFLLFIAHNSESQNYKFIYYLDKDLNSTEKDKAVILGKGYERNAVFTLDCFLKSSGRMTVSASVKDSSLSTLHGLFTTYYDDMKIESAGNYFENDMEGVWKYWDKDGFLTDSVIYRNSIRIAYANYEYYFSKPTLEQFFFRDSLKSVNYSYLYSYTDSLKNSFEEKQVSVTNGTLKTEFEVYFIGERGLFKVYDSTGSVKIDSVFTKKMHEAEFGGGEDEWRNFLRKTLNPLVPANNNAPAGKYTIIMTFIITPNGKLSNIKAESDPGYGMVEEAKRVLKMYKWKPAIQFGNYRIAYRKQPITFVVEN